MKKPFFLLVFFGLICPAPIATANESFAFFSDYLTSVNHLKKIEDRSLTLDAISDSLSTEESARRYVALFRMGIVDLKAARQVIGKHRNSSNNLIGEAAEYIYIACRIREQHHQEMIAYITDDQVDPDGPEYDAAMESLQSSREIFKDASSLARHTLLDTRGLDEGDTITHFTITRDQHKDLVDEIHRFFGDDPENAYQKRKGPLEYQVVTLFRLLNDKRFKCRDEE